MLLQLILISVMLLQSCQKAPSPIPQYTLNTNSAVARDWFKLHNKLIKETPGFTAPVAARSFGYAGITLYQAVVPGMNGYNSLAGKLNGLSIHELSKSEAGKSYNWGLVANAAMADFYRNTFKTASIENKALIDKLENDYLSIFKDAISSQDELSRSITYGKQIAYEVNLYAKSDGMEEAYKTNYPAYSFPVGKDKYRPTGSETTPLQPYWGKVRPFMLIDVDQAQPVNPPVYSMEMNSTFYNQAIEVYNFSKSLTEEQKTIGEFWADGDGTYTPPGHSISIATQVLEQERASLAKAAETYLKVGLALHDAYISCWKSKFDNNVVRPISYIHMLIDANFNTLVNTPPSPEYSCEYAVQSSAALTVLTDLFGTNYKFSDFTNYGRTDIVGNPRNYSSFEQAAQEAAISGLYSGIQFRKSIEDGLTQGKKIGASISTLNLKN